MTKRVKVSELIGCADPDNSCEMLGTTDLNPNAIIYKKCFSKKPPKLGKEAKIVTTKVEKGGNPDYKSKEAYRITQIISNHIMVFTRASYWWNKSPYSRNPSSYGRWQEWIAIKDVGVLRYETEEEKKEVLEKYLYQSSDLLEAV